MAYLVKASLVLVLIVCAYSQATTYPYNIAQGTKSLPQPDASWDDYQIKSCCPKGFNEVGNYCVQCNAPYVFDSADQKCRPCPSDHIFNNQTGRCDCTVPCAAPRQINPANNQCECQTFNGTRMTYQPDTNKCVCPSNLPLWNGKYCVACPTGTEFDPK